MLDARRLAGAGDSLIVLTFHDVTERKQAERTTSLLAAIVDSSDDAIISKKLDGTITSWNQSAERLFGYKAEEAVGQHITLIVPWERRSEEEDILRRLAEASESIISKPCADGKTALFLDVSLTISPIRDAAGRVIGASEGSPRHHVKENALKRHCEKAKNAFGRLSKPRLSASNWFQQMALCCT